WLFKKVGDELMLSALLNQTWKMKKVDYAVVLAFDNVYDVDGTYKGPKQNEEHEILSTIYVSNRFVSDLCKNHSNLLFGLSVHPFRDDAVDEISKYHENAVLCKWIPSSHLLDLSEDNQEAQQKLDKFYKKLAEINLPLLFHTGVETSIPASVPDYEKFNSPKYIKKALEMGVTVILAHCGCSYFDLIQDDFVADVIELFKEQESQNKEWNLYADISALFSPFRNPKILDDIFKNIPANKLIYGSDFPNPAKGRKEFFLRPFLRFRKANLLNRYFKISKKWLSEYYSESESYHIFTNFHRLLHKLGRGDLINQ
ncbi:MAG: amidohydrolase family protein, partial [Candidatus Aminicenantes bacterium]|nr:amidohydrolase family protein [Candidatus Aminicenantes bacterium]